MQPLLINSSVYVSLSILALKIANNTLYLFFFLKSVFWKVGQHQNHVEKGEQWVGR